MAYFESGLQLNNGQTIVISSHHLDWFNPIDADQNLYAYYSEGVNTPASGYNLSGYCNPSALIFSENDLGQCLGRSGHALTPEYMESAEYQSLLSRVNGNISWIWGNIEDGGAGIRRVGDNSYQFVFVTGKYTGTVSNTVYDYTIAGNYKSEDLLDVIFTVADQYMYDENGRFQLQMWINGVSPQSSMTPIAVSDQLQIIEQDLPMYDTPYGDVTWDYVGEKIGFNFNKPLRIFRNYSPVYCWSTYSVANLTYESGDWSGGLLVDVDGGGNSEYGGGDGDFNDNSDNVDPSNGDDITNDVLTSGFITLYRPTLAQIKSFNNFLFTDITDSIAEQIKRLQTNPLDYVVNISMCHFTPPSVMSNVIKFAGISSGVGAPLISQQFITKYLGSVTLSEYFGTFLDYNPYTKCELYLPYIGVVPINIDDVQKGTISIYYTIDLLTGSCIAQVKTSRSKRSTGDSAVSSVLYEFQGNCFLNIPLSATNWHGTYQSIIQGISGIGQAIGGNVLGGAGQIASAVISEKVSCQRTGSLQPAHGFMGKQYPYFILSRPIQNLPYNFNGFEGYTSNVRDKVKNLKGYTEIDESTIWTDNFGHATQEECQMIKDIMNKGVYL